MIRALALGLLVGLIAIPAPGAAQLPGEAEDPIALDTLPVLGSRISSGLPLRTRSVQVMDREALDRLPVRNLAQALEWATSVELGARSPAQADLSIRGAGFEQLLVLVDGVRMSDPQTGHFDLDLTVPLERVERIEILRGPGSALYGSDAVGGVVNVVTRDGGAWSGRVEGGSFGTASGLLQGGVSLPGEGSLQLSGERGRSDGHREGTEWDSRIGSLDLRVPVAEGELRVGAATARRAFGADGFYAPFPSHETTRTRTAHAGWRSDPGASVSLEPRVSWRSHGDDFILDRADPAGYRNRHTSDQVAAELVVRGAPLGGLSLAGGAELARHELRSNALGDRAEGRGALFAEAAVIPAWGPEFTAGLRHDRYGPWGGFTSPSLAAGLDLGAGLRLHGSVGRAFRGPSWTERHYQDPVHAANPELDPERSTSVELGGTLRTSTMDRWLGITGFRRTGRDLIDWARPVGDSEAIWVTRNVNRSRTRGLEMEAGARLDSGTSVNIAGTWLSLAADAPAEFESKQLLRPIQDRIRLSLSQELPRSVLGSVHLARSRRTAEESFVELDLRLEAPTPFGTLFLDGRNLTDSRHLDLTGHPVAARALYVGASVGR